MKRLSAKTYAQLYFSSATAVSTAKRSVVASKFLQLVRRHRATKLLPRIMGYLQEIEDRAHQRTRIAVTSAKTGDASTLTKHLSNIFGPVVLDLTVDPSLRGGLVLRVGDDEIDGSLRTRLRRLHQHLTHD